MKLQIQHNAKNFSSSWGAISSSERTLELISSYVFAPLRSFAVSSASFPNIAPENLLIDTLPT
jgi:hypothetical protein